MNDSPQGGAGAAIASLAATAVILIIMAAMIASTGGLQQPLTARQSAVAMTPSHHQG